MRESPAPILFCVIPTASKANLLFFNSPEPHTRHRMYAPIRAIVIMLFAASTVAPALSASLSSDIIARDESLGIRDRLQLRQDPLNAKCQAFYGTKDCYVTEVDDSGADGAHGACVCPYVPDGQSDQDQDCRVIYDNNYCYHDEYLWVLPGPIRLACACPIPGQ